MLPRLGKGQATVVWHVQALYQVLYTPHSLPDWEHQSCSR